MVASILQSWQWERKRREGILQRCCVMNCQINVSASPSVVRGRRSTKEKRETLSRYDCANYHIAGQKGVRHVRLQVRLCASNERFAKYIKSMPPSHNEKKLFCPPLPFFACSVAAPFGIDSQSIMSLYPLVVAGRREVSSILLPGSCSVCTNGELLVSSSFCNGK